MDGQGFVESSELHVVVPQSTQAGLEDLFTHDDADHEETRAHLSLGVGQRSLLYFGTFTPLSLKLLPSYSFLGTP